MVLLRTVPHTRHYDPLRMEKLSWRQVTLSVHWLVRTQEGSRQYGPHYFNTLPCDGATPNRSPHSPLRSTANGETLVASGDPERSLASADPGRLQAVRAALFQYPAV